MYKKLLAVTSFAVLFMFGGCLGSEKDIHNKVADDAVIQYEIAKKNGAAIDICVAAGMVKAAYLQAKNESSYAKWTETEKQDCEAAGIPK